jgi:protein-S-isoprenylcysteine O-methyltransferase Ste14
MLRLALFVLLTSVWLYLSRASLRSRRSHGFYRFYAIELILVLVFLNFVSLGQWFEDPLSPRQLVSWVLLVASLVALVPAVSLLITEGNPEVERSDEEQLIRFEGTTRLVTTGVFGYIRHPMYASLLFLAWGVLFKRPSWIALGLALGATAFLVATAKTEEVENVRYFGSAYDAYKKTTKMFVPFLF